MHVSEHITGASERGWQWFSERAHGRHAIGWLIVIAFLEPIFSPIVPETLMVAMLLARSDDWLWKKYAAITTVASFLGGMTGYMVGFMAFRWFGESLLGYFGLGDIAATVGTIISGNIFLIMIFITFTPIPDKAFTILSGFVGAPFLPYAFGYLIGRTARFTAVAYAVHRWGMKVVELLNRYFMYAALILLAIGTIYVMVHWHLLPL